MRSARGGGRGGMHAIVRLRTTRCFRPCFFRKLPSLSASPFFFPLPSYWTIAKTLIFICFLFTLIPFQTSRDTDERKESRSKEFGGGGGDCRIDHLHEIHSLAGREDFIDSPRNLSVHLADGYGAQPFLVNSI